MTGPEHYREAERLAGLAGTTEVGMAAALVHATLALTAATVASWVAGEDVLAAWADVTT